MPSIDLQDADSGLAPHPHRLTLRGDPSDWAFPPLCPHCGAAATRQLAVTKAFRRTHSEAPTSHVVASVAVPFCDACIARHEAAATPISPLGRLLSGFGNGEMLGAVLPAMAAAFCVYLALKDLASGRADRSPFMLLVAGLFAGIAWLQRGHAWRTTEHLRVPRQTDIVRAFDFSDDIAPAFEPPRFACTIRDARFAQAFRDLNREREWVANSPAAREERRRANRKGWVVGAVVVLVALVGMWMDE